MGSLEGGSTKFPSIAVTEGEFNLSLFMQPLQSKSQSLTPKQAIDKDELPFICKQPWIGPGHFFGLISIPVVPRERRGDPLHMMPAGIHNTTRGRCGVTNHQGACWWTVGEKPQHSKFKVGEPKLDHLYSFYELQPQLLQGRLLVRKWSPLLIFYIFLKEVSNLVFSLAWL